MTLRAIVDIGSNSVSSTITGGPWVTPTIDVVGLLRGASGGILSGEALARLDMALASAAMRLVDVDPSERYVFATSAVRDAPNASHVAAIVERRLGTRLHVLSGSQEAALTFRGAYAGLGLQGPAIVLDPGGGSTEVAVGDHNGVRTSESLQLGAVRDSEAFLYSDPPTAREITRCRANARQLLGGAVVATGAAFEDAAVVIGVAGTVTTLAAISIGEYDPKRVHGLVLKAARVHEICLELSASSQAKLARTPGVLPARAATIVAGSIIVDEALNALGAKNLTVSDRNILDGVAADPSVLFAA